VHHRDVLAGTLQAGANLQHVSGHAGGDEVGDVLLKDVECRCDASAKPSQ
jgi:hypothetical protein